MLAVIQGLQSEKISITEFLGQILQDPSYSNHPLVIDLHLDGVKICDLIHNTTPPSPLQNGSSVVISWTINTSIKYFQKELCDFMHTPVVATIIYQYMALAQLTLYIYYHSPPSRFDPLTGFSRNSAWITPDFCMCTLDIHIYLFKKKNSLRKSPDPTLRIVHPVYVLMRQRQWGCRSCMASLRVWLCESERREGQGGQRKG